MGFVPFVVLLVNNLLSEFTGWAIALEWATLGAVGDIFGAANALFAGAALLMAVLAIRQQGDTIRQQAQALEFQQLELKFQRLDLQAQTEEMSQQTTAHEAAARNESRALSASVVLPLAEKIRTPEYGKSIQTLAQLWRTKGTDSLPENQDWGSLLERYRDRSLDQEDLAVFEQAMAAAGKYFSVIRQKYKFGTATSDEQKEFAKIDASRRYINDIIQLLRRLYVADVIDNRIARIVASVNVASDYKYCVLPLDLSIEQERNPSASAYPIGQFVTQLYTEDELRAAMY